MELTTQQRLDLRRLFDDATLVDAVAAACQVEADQWTSRLQAEVMAGVHTGQRNYQSEGYCAAQVDAWRNLVGKLKAIGKQPIQT